MITRQRLSDSDLNIRICPGRARWPEPSAGSTWETAHRCVHALQNFVRGVDNACGEVEADEELSAPAIARRRSEICDQSLRKLLNFAAFEIAEKALTRDIDALERLSDRDPEQAQMLQKLTKVLADLRDGIPATQRMVRDRCKTREGVSV